jgi:hypothetical protein
MMIFQLVIVTEIGNILKYEQLNSNFMERHSCLNKDNHIDKNGEICLDKLHFGMLLLFQYFISIKAVNFLFFTPSRFSGNQVVIE